MKAFPYLILCASLLLVVAVVPTHAQNSVGIGTENPSPRAVLHLVSSGQNQGLLVPTLTTAQRNAEEFVAELSAAESGLLVFDSQQNVFYYWMNSGGWTPMVSGLVGGDLSGQLTNLSLNEAVVEADNLASNSVSSIKIVDNSVTTTDLASPGANKVLISTNAGTVFWENLNIFGTVRLDEGFIYVGNSRNEPTPVVVSGDLTVGSNGVADLADEVIRNENISPAAGIAVSKLQDIPAGNIIYGNAANEPTLGTLGGDATLNSAGQLTLANSVQTRSNLGLDQSNVSITGGTVTADLNGNGSGIANLNAANVSSGVLSEDRLPNLSAAATVYGDPADNNPITSVAVDQKGRVTNATVGTPSDQRLKKDWVALTNSAEKLRQITPYAYRWKQGDEQMHLGVMAQEVEQVFPSLVHVREDGFRTVNYPGLIPPMLNALQEQQRTIDALQSRLDEQERQYQEVRNELATIRDLLEQQK
ncbi:MAG: tail fiber domain-containing protein [Tunicatimonas sp.]